MAKDTVDQGDIVFEARDLRINAVRQDGSELPIVKGVSFEVRRGEVVALIGESGSGKTTISLSALGYCKPGLKFAGGEALLLGNDLTDKTTDELRPSRGINVAYLAQSAAATFNPSIKINEQVTESPVLHRTKTQAEANTKALSLYRALELPDPENIGDRYPHQVSGGQLQRLMAAMALCGDPDLLVLDEPTTALDVTTQIEVLKAFKEVIKEEGAAAIYVTHDLSVVAQIADHIVVLYNGEVKEAGPTEVIINEPRHPYTRRLMAAIKPLPEAGQGEETDDAHLRDAPALEARDVDAGYGGIGADGKPQIPVLHDINVAIERGRTVGIIGESGCGKSTLARVLAGLLPASGGEVLLHGETLPAAVEKRTREQLRKVQFVYQMADTALNPRQKISRILGRPLEFYGGIKGAAKRRRVEELLEMVELPAQFADRYPHELSGGQKQRINLARALAAEPEVVLCDEVTSALDTIVAANVIELLKRLRRETGVSFVFISHDLSTVSSFADEIVVLYAGRVAEQGATDKVLSPPYHPYTRLLISSVPETRIGWLEDATATREARSGIAGSIDLMAKGCPFYDRCPLAIPDVCNVEDPPRRHDGVGHVIECHREVTELGGQRHLPAIRSVALQRERDCQGGPSVILCRDALPLRSRRHDMKTSARSIFADEFSSDPFWWRDSRPADLPQQDLPETTDAAIIGSGYAGLCCATELARAGLDVTVLDANAIGTGASSRAAGFVTGRAGVSKQIDLKAAVGSTRATAILEEADEAYEHLQTVIATEGIDCDFQPVGRFVGANTPKAYDKLARKAAEYAGDGTDRFEMVPRAEQDRFVRSDFFHGGMTTFDAGSVHPAKYHAGLLRLCREAGVRFLPSTRVTGVEAGTAGAAVLHTTRGTLQARQVMLGTGGYTDDVSPWHQRRIIPMSSTIIATERLGKEQVSHLLPAGCPVIDTKRVIAFARPSPDGAHVLFGGRARFTPVSAEESVRILHAQMCEFFPELETTKVINAWSGFMAFTFDFLPKVGRQDGLHYALACNGGAGIVMMSWLGRKAAWQMLGTANRESAFEGLPFRTQPFYSGTPWFVPFIGSWYRLRDWIDLREVRARRAA